MPIVDYSTPGSSSRSGGATTLLTVASFALALGPSLCFAVISARRPDQFTGLFLVFLMPASALVGLVLGCVVLSNPDARRGGARGAAWTAVILNGVQVLLLVALIGSRLKF